MMTVTTHSLGIEYELCHGRARDSHSPLVVFHIELLGWQTVDLAYSIETSPLGSDPTVGLAHAGMLIMTPPSFRVT